MSKVSKVKGSITLCHTECNIIENAGNVIQNCFKTHGGRIKWRNAVAKHYSCAIAGGLRQ